MKTWEDVPVSQRKVLLVAGKRRHDPSTRKRVEPGKISRAITGKEWKIRDLNYF